MTASAGQRPPRIGMPMSTVTRPSVRWTISPAYVRAVRVAGGLSIPIPLVTDTHSLDEYLAGLDGLLLCGGGDIAPARYGGTDTGLCDGIDRDRDTVELYLATRAAELGLPTLGICRGIQVLNVAAGGTLIQDIPTQWHQPAQHRTPASAPRDTLAHAVELDPQAADPLRVVPACAELCDAWRATSELMVNSTHHQAVDRLGSGYSVAGTAQDGIIEAIVATESSFRLGVQWHPEELLDGGHDGLHRALFTSLVHAAAQRREA